MLKIAGNEFERLYKQFKDGAAWLNEQIAKRGRTPWVADQIFRFERDVMAPMDKAWQRLNEQQREYFRIHKKGI